MADSQISSFLWSAADLLRSSFKQHEYGDIILPFTVLRRLDVSLQPTKQAVLEAAKKPVPAVFANNEDQAKTYKNNQLKKASGFEFYNTSSFTMDELLDESNDIKDNLVEYVSGYSDNIQEIMTNFKFADVIKDLNDADLLYLIVEHFCSPKVDLSPANLSNADMGDVYEELIRKFSEVSNETAGEHFSPRDGLALAVRLLICGAEEDLTTPYRIAKCCDPCAGTGGALSVFEDEVMKLNPNAKVVSYAQEINPQSYAICKSDIILKGSNADNVFFGDTLANDRMPEEKFGYQVSNPPYGVDWKKSKTAVMEEYNDKGFAGRFGAGTPKISDGQLLFLQHMISKMRPVEDGGGRIAVFLNGSPLFSGNAGSGESEIRKWVLENDYLEGIVAMPTDFFFNTGIATYIWVLNNNKPEYRKNKVQLLNATDMGTKMRKSLGSKRKELTEDAIEEIVRMWSAFEETEICKIFDYKEFGYTTVKISRPLIDEETGEIMCDKKGKPLADKSLADSENIPLKEDIDEYIAREVLPYAPGAWIEEVKDKRTKAKVRGIVGYEIPFTRYFYKYTPLRSSTEILKELEEVEASIAEKLAKARS